MAKKSCEMPWFIRVAFYLQFPDMFMNIKEDESNKLIVPIESIDMLLLSLLQK